MYGINAINDNNVSQKESEKAHLPVLEVMLERSKKSLGKND